MPTLGTALILLMVSLAAHAQSTDPCDFSQRETFSYEQVLACYRSVPYCPHPNVSAECDRDAQVKHIRQTLEWYSDLRDTYEAKYGWREQLEAISHEQFSSDFDQYTAISEFFANFRSDHWYYFGPGCFEQVMFSLIPLNFGSSVKAGEQIIYLRQAQPEGLGGFDLSGWNDLYLEATGIDVAALVGQRVVLIQGKPPLKFFREWGRTSLRQDDSDGINLMSILDEAGYTLRSGSYNPFPESRAISVVLEDSAGTRASVELPWMFVPYAAIGYPPAPASSEEFRALCFAPNAGAAQRRFNPSHREPMAYLAPVAQRHEWVARALKAHARKSANVPQKPFGRDVTEIFPLSDGARTVALGDRTVAIQLRQEFVAPWQDELAKGASYACDNADRLIIDLRGNLGGYVSRIEEMAHFFAPDTPAYPDAILPRRELARSPALDELRLRSEQLAALGFEPCYTGFEAACVLTPSGKPVSAPFWYRHVFTETRGNSLESLTPLGTQLNGPRSDYTIACPGKFTGDKLIILANGLNSSAAYFAAQLLRQTGTLVLAGGYLGEPMEVGRDRGGPVSPSSYYGDTTAFLEDALGVRLAFHLASLPRPVVFHFEHDAFYRPGLWELYVDRSPPADIQIPFWSNTLDTDAAAYRAAITAVGRTH